MSQFKQGDKVVHLGGLSGVNSANRGKVLTIIDGPYKIVGYVGERYIVDKACKIHMHDEYVYHANAEHLLKLK